MSNFAAIVRSRGTRLPLLCAAFLSGCAVMILELTAARAMAPAFGASLYTWTNVIGVVLLALSLGYWWGGVLADRRPDARRLASILLLSALLSIPAPFLIIPLADALLPAPTSLSPFVATGHLVRGSLAVSLLLFAPPLLLMGMVGPFVTRLLVDTGLDGGKAAGRTLAVGTLGSLLGTWLPAHFLLDRFGVKATLLTATVLLAATGVLLFVWMRILRPGPLLVLVLSGLAMLAGAGLPQRPAIGDFRTAYGPSGLALEEVELLAEVDSPYQYVRVSRFREGGADGVTQIRMTLDEGITEFHSLLAEGRDLTGAYYDFFTLLPELAPGDRPLRVAILGGGAGSMARLFRIFKGDRIGQILSVEIDPAVAGFSGRFGWDPSPPDATVVADGRVFLRLHDEPFDVIILDAYSRQISIPPHLASAEFMDLVSRRLRPGGVFAINVSTPDFESPLAFALYRTIRRSFDSLAAVSIPGSWNGMLIAKVEPGASFRVEPADDALADIRRMYHRGLFPVPAYGASGALLTDDRAPMEKLARIP